MSKLLVPARLRQENILDPWAYLKHTEGTLSKSEAQGIDALYQFQSTVTEGSFLFVGLPDPHMLIAAANASHDGEAIAVVAFSGGAIDMLLYQLRHWSQPGEGHGDLVLAITWDSRIEAYRPYRVVVFGTSMVTTVEDTFAALRGVSDYLARDGVVFLPNSKHLHEGWQRYHAVSHELSPLGRHWLHWKGFAASGRYEADYDRIISEVKGDGDAPQDATELGPEGWEDRRPADHGPDGDAAGPDRGLGDGGPGVRGEPAGEPGRDPTPQPGGDGLL